MIRRTLKRARSAAPIPPSTAPATTPAPAVPPVMVPLRTPSEQPAAAPTEPTRHRAEVQNRIVGVVGRKGSGKSTKVRELLRYCPRWVAFDPMSDHAELAGGNVLESPEALEKFLKWSRGEQFFAGVYVPSEEPAEEIEEVSRLIYGRGDLCFVCEEVPIYTMAGYIPPLFGKLIRTGRHRRLDVCWTAQRAAEVPKTLTSLTDVWVLFSQTEPKDLTALAERCGREVADSVAALGPHDYFLWDAVGRQVLADSPRLLRRDSAAREAVK